MGPTNTYAVLVFSERVWGDPARSTAVAAADFSFAFSTEWRHPPELHFHRPVR